LLARTYDRRKSLRDDVFPLLCPTCGGEMRIVAFITGASSVSAIFFHCGGLQLYPVTHAKPG
jgi:hypothetical protein